MRRERERDVGIDRLPQRHPGQRDLHFDVNGAHFRGEERSLLRLRVAPGAQRPIAGQEVLRGLAIALLMPLPWGAASIRVECAAAEPMVRAPGASLSFPR